MYDKVAYCHENLVLLQKFLRPFALQHRMHICILLIFPEPVLCSKISAFHTIKIKTITDL